ncbi:Nitrate reductase (NADH) [Ananas comosus]|uniref:Nitrate reductase (NADH) n=1 Tax=Ananas comosus TaxID=4615 RepID=A0A199W8M5_ANACO|nr:Nitrate reductase (NADH) [Ananas comosus]
MANHMNGGGGGGGGGGGRFAPPPLAQILPRRAPDSDDEEEEEEEDDDDVEDSDWAALCGSHEEVEPSVQDPRDEGTSDRWVRRNPSLIRLTGKHPFNSEPPLPRLMHHGFLTPAPLHYVRNHGPVPRADWSAWTVEVAGLVRRPARLTMDQLVRDFPPVEIPVTLVCAGNRRKEHNMARQTVGFSWGPGAVSTSVWRGARLRDVLRRCGIAARGSGARHVRLEGAEDLPGGGGGGKGSKYGTSLRREVAMDVSRDVLLAYMQNGELLSPDHGFPVRVVIPGFIGGRMVKWLRKITVAPEESDSYYHYHDNRVLPSHVDAELANAEDWWHKPEYIINELNINSVITTPCNDEILPINALTTLSPYTIRGYAYSGGGRKVTRVEVTLDGGESWVVCAVDHREKPNKFGKYWCWCFWSVDVEILDLLGAKEIAVRAWDESLNTQPEKLIWNVMGMMNNCWFRVKVAGCRPYRGEIGLVFEHPTQPGNQPGGWMAKQKHLETSTATAAAAAARLPTLKKSTSSPFMNTAAQQFSMSEHPKFPDGGVMSQYLESLPIGSAIDIKGPLGHIEYSGRGNFMVNGKPRFARRLAMIAGGTGITPVYQVIQAVLRDQPDDRTEMHLVYTNRSEDNILLRDELDWWAAVYPDRLRVWYVVDRLSRPDKEWRYSIGFVTEAILQEHVPAGGADDTLALACGPQPMIQFAVLPNLEKMKYDKSDSIFIF